MNSALLSPTPANPHPAIERCLQAGRVAHGGALLLEQPEYECQERFRDAYLAALPDLSTHENVCAFIACVSYGMINGVIYRDAARSYLYASQVALSAVPRTAARPKTAAA